MTLFRNQYRVESTRLKGFDYSQPGYYFVTICLKDQIPLFGELFNGEVVLNGFGVIVQECLLTLPSHYPQLVLDEFIVMPNHVHVIFCITDCMNQPSNVETGFVETGLKPVSTMGLNESSNLETGLKPVSTMGNPHRRMQRHGVSEFVRAFKTFSAKQINEMRGTIGYPVWQRGFYERIIRDDAGLQAVRHYIKDNPLNVQDDPESH